MEIYSINYYSFKSLVSNDFIRRQSVKIATKNPEFQITGLYNNQNHVLQITVLYNN